MDVRSYAFVVARALVTEIKNLQQGSSNGKLQADDILKFFTGSQAEVYHPEVCIFLMNFMCLFFLDSGSIAFIYGNE